jgi:hypothetical protein
MVLTRCVLFGHELAVLNLLHPGKANLCGTTLGQMILHAQPPFIKSLCLNQGLKLMNEMINLGPRHDPCINRDKKIPESRRQRAIIYNNVSARSSLTAGGSSAGPESLKRMHRHAAANL